MARAVMTQGATIPAIVVGETVTALGALRGLTRSGIEAYTVTSPGEIVRYSRWYKPIPGNEELRPEAITKWLSSVVAGQAVLIPCSDHTVLQSSILADKLDDRILASIPSTSVIETLIDKAKFASVLDRIGIPHPNTWQMDDEEAVFSLPDRAFSGAFLKPADSQSFIRRFGIKAERVSSKQHAVTQLAEYSRQGFLMVLQEYIPGASDQHYFIDGFVDRHQEVKTLFARRRLRMHPPDFGNSSYMVSVSLDEVQGAGESIRGLLKELDYRGIFSAEFKFDARDGEFKLLEVNARPWWYIEFAARCGVNICEMAYLDALGEDVGDAWTYRAGASMVYTRHDYFACRDSLRRGDMSAGDWFMAWFQSWRPIFAWDDPWPSCVGTMRFLSRRILRPFTWLTRKLYREA